MIQVYFQIEGNASPETVERLRSYGDDFAQRVIQVFEDLQADRARRVYL